MRLHIARHHFTGNVTVGRAVDRLKVKQQLGTHPEKYSCLYGVPTLGFNKKKMASKWE